MARVFITGSADGLGRAAAETLIREGHQVVIHARSDKRAAQLNDIVDRAAGVVIGDLALAEETRGIADQVNTIGTMDAIIHNAGVYLEPARGSAWDDHARTFAINTLAPFMLTGLIARPARLIYLSSGMHRSGEGSLRDIDWRDRRWDATQAYCESKLHLAALSAAISRLWPDVLSNAVDPGWVPTKMGGSSAPDDLEMGHQTQTWLAVSDDPAAKVSGRYWHHRQQQATAGEVSDLHFQDDLMAKLSELTGVSLFSA